MVLVDRPSQGRLVRSVMGGVRAPGPSELGGGGGGEGQNVRVSAHEHELLGQRARAEPYRSLSWNKV